MFYDDVRAINGWNEAFLGFWRQDTEFALRLMRSGVRRRDAVFSAILYHLEHDKPLVRADLERNDRLLAAAHTAAVFTPQGLYPTEEERRAA